MGIPSNQFGAFSLVTVSEMSPALSEILVDGKSIIQVTFRKKLQL